MLINEALQAQLLPSVEAQQDLIFTDVCEMTKMGSLPEGKLMQAFAFLVLFLRKYSHVWCYYIYAICLILITRKQEKCFPYYPRT